MTESTQFVDLYELLKVDPQATEADIRTAIRQVRREWTRRQGNPDVEVRGLAERTLVKIASAEGTLLDPDQRRDYDSDYQANKVVFLDAAAPVAPMPAAPVAAQPAPAPAPAPAPQPERPVATPVENWLVQARQQMRAQQWSDSRYSARRAMDVSQTTAEAWWLAAHSSLMMGDLADAAKESRTASRLDPQNVEYLVTSAQVQLELRQYDEAHALWQRVNSLDPSDARADTGVARLLTETGRHREAVEVLERSVATHPSDLALEEMLASTLTAAARASLSVGTQGQVVVTNQHQVGALSAAVDRLRALSQVSPFIQSQVNELAYLRDQSQTVKHHPSAKLKWYAIGFGLLLLAFIGSLGDGSAGSTILLLLLLGAVGFAYYKRHFIPLWKFERTAQPEYVLRSGLQ